MLFRFPLDRNFQGIVGNNGTFPGTWIRIPAIRPKNRDPPPHTSRFLTRAAVVVFDRSGNAAVIAHHILEIICKIHSVTVSYYNKVGRCVIVRFMALNYFSVLVSDQRNSKAVASEIGQCLEEVFGLLY